MPLGYTSMRLMAALDGKRPFGWSSVNCPDSRMAGPERARPEPAVRLAFVIGPASPNPNCHASIETPESRHLVVFRQPRAQLARILSSGRSITVHKFWLLIAFGLVTPAAAQTYGPELQGFDYPFPVHEFGFASQQQTLTMAYLDVAPTAAANGKVAVLLHGKNFCAATWEGTITALTGAGYRVIAPDQIGFCKSAKPHAYQFTFQALARNTRALLQVARDRPCGHDRTFHRRHAGDPLRADVPGGHGPPGAGGPDRAGGLEGEGRPLDQRG